LAGAGAAFFAGAAFLTGAVFFAAELAIEMGVPSSR
jgi:hypothetical protein